MPLIDAKTLAKELGISPKQVRRLALTEKIPAFRLDGVWRFDLQAVLDSARYKDPIAASAHRAARKIWLQPKRPFIRPPVLPKKKDQGTS